MTARSISARIDKLAEQVKALHGAFSVGGCGGLDASTAQRIEVVAYFIGKWAPRESLYEALLRALAYDPPSGLREDLRADGSGFNDRFAEAQCAILEQAGLTPETIIPERADEVFRQLHARIPEDRRSRLSGGLSGH
jgi:hypothetical protein